MTIEPSSVTQTIISRNWEQVCEKVASACSAAGRDPQEVLIVGVAKYVGPEFTAQLIQAGCTTIGENRPQNLWQKREWLAANCVFPKQVQWHLIGHLQRNKVRRTLPMVDVIESIDSLRLAKEVSQEAASARLTIRVLLDVNVTQDSTKTGFLPEQLRADIETIVELPNLTVCGLMAMSSLDASKSQIRDEFRAVRQLRDELSQRLGCPQSFSELSMGMSGDYQEAIAEGATCVRIGSHLWKGIIP